MIHRKRGLFIFLLAISFLTFVLFWQVFVQKKIPFNANLLASFYNPWAQEKFVGWEQGIPNKPTAKDDLWIFYPQRTFTNSILNNLEIPFWNPYSFSGNYHLGLSETAVFYPLNVLFLFFSQVDAWVFLIIIEPIIAGLGMFLFLRNVVIHQKSAILGALAFAFSGIVIVRAVEGLSVGHTLIWIPFVFYGIESFFQTKKIRFLWLILLFLTLSLLAGWFQYTFYIMVLALLYTLFKLIDSNDRSKISFLILVPFLLFPLVTLFHTLPALQALLESPRSALEGRLFSYQHLMPVFHLFTLIIPDFWGNPAVYTYFGKSDYKESVLFIGVVTLVFSLITLFKPKKKKELFFIGVIIVSFLLAIDNFVSRAIITSPIPVLSSFLPNRIFLVTTFSFCILAAFGMDYVLQEKKNAAWLVLKKTFISLWFVSIILGSFLAWRILKDPSLLHKVDRVGINISTEAIQFKNAILPFLFLFATTVIFFVFRKNYARTIFFLAVVTVLFLQSYIFGQKYIPFSYRQFVYPTHPVFEYLAQHQQLDRFMSIGYGHIVPSIPLQFGLYSPEGIGSMYIRRYAELVRYMKMEDFGIPDKIAFDLEIYPKDVFSPRNSRLSRFFELTSVKHIVVDKKSMKDSKIIPAKEMFALAWENDTWQIYEYAKSMPRFFTTSNFEIRSDSKTILTSLFSDAFNPKKIIVEQDPGFHSQDYQGNVEVIEYSPNKISMSVSADQPTLVYFSDNYSKAFKAIIDGREGKILRANYTFRAIPVSSGNHTVIVQYDNSAVVIGFIVAIATILVAVILPFLIHVTKGRER